MRILFVVIFLFATTAHAISEFDVGLDLLQHGLSRTSKDETGEKSFVGPTFINFDLQAHFDIGNDFLLSPRIVYMPGFLFPHKDTGSNAKSNFLILSLPVNFRVSPSFDAELGPAYVTYTITGSGGTTTLNNGNGLSTFAQPDGSATSKTLGVLTGAAYKFSTFRISADLLTEGILSSQKRTFSFIGAFSYAFY